MGKGAIAGVRHAGHASSLSAFVGPCAILNEVPNGSLENPCRVSETVSGENVHVSSVGLGLERRHDELPTKDVQNIDTIA